VALLVMSDEQEKRTAKALAGLADGTMKVTPTSENVWRVANGDKEPYIVVRVRSGWACDCPDWTGRCKQRGLRCKHCEAVRLTSPHVVIAANSTDATCCVSTPPQKENPHMDEQLNTNGWTKLYHPCGAQVTLPVPVSDPAAGLTAVSAYLSAGWLVNAPGLEDGERVDDIGFVVKRVKANDDGSETPVIDLYPPRANFRILGVYLNTPDDVKTFESACGVKLASLPLYEGDNAIERGKGPKTDKYVVSLPHPVKAVFKANPKWEGDEDKKHPKRLFVRWGNSTPANGQPATEQKVVNGNGEQKAAAPANGHGQPVSEKAANGNGNGDLQAKLTAAHEFVMPEGKTTKGKKLGSLDDATLKLIAGEQYQPTTPEGKQAKVYAAQLLQLAPIPF
jgi:hypothetical protein